MITTTGIEINSCLKKQMINLATRTGEKRCNLLFKINTNNVMGEYHVVIECRYNPNFNSIFVYQGAAYLGSIFNINNKNEEFVLIGYVKSFTGEMSCSDEDFRLIEQALLQSTCDIVTI